MALHRPRKTAGPSHVLAAPAATGLALAVGLVAGLAAFADMPGDPALLTTEYGLGAVMLVLSLAGLFTCAAFGTSFTAGEDEPRGGSARPVPVRIGVRPRRPPGP
ncbi:hypothetical protein [Rhodoplanes roseus]|uniref:Uncharacterized protein n=1 Tax=Rhodoplanes roseus TaxID=29409 RepID=A0A327KN88_9BRAD|nr:hypothetical protein [Rhodoplanes roseus]RAI38772.1 hypothetical protein CH341_27215 [Rhodoplanes roseus]